MIRKQKHFSFLILSVVAASSLIVSSGVSVFAASQDGTAADNANTSTNAASAASSDSNAAINVNSTAGAETNETDEPPKMGSKRYGSSKLTNDRSEITADKRKLLLTTGEDKAVDLEFEVANANAISVGNPKTVATTLVKIGDKRQIVFKPLDKGETNVTIRDVNGDIRLIFNVRVAGSDLLRVAGEIRDLLRDVEGVDVRVVGSKVVVDGEVITPNDFGRVSAVLGDASYGSNVISLVQLSSKALASIAKRIQDDIHNFGAANVTTRVVNGVIFLEGTVDNNDQAVRAVKITDTYIPAIRPNSLLENDRNTQARSGRPPYLNFIVINPPPPKKQEKLVRVTFHFVQLSKDYTKLFAFEWQPGFTNDPAVTIGAGTSGGVAAGGTSFTGTLTSLFPKLQTAQQAGYARILRTGTVIVRSGQPAQISESTSLPFSAAGQNGQINAGTQQIQVEFGVTPQILGQSEDISMEVKTSVSSIVGRAPTGQTQAITDSNVVQTKIYVKSSESAAIGGMNFSDVGTDFDKDSPFAAANTATGQTTTPLFDLLHSKEYRKKKSQFVVFVTPQIVENASDGTEDLKRNFRVKVK